MGVQIRIVSTVALLFYLAGFEGGAHVYHQGSWAWAANFSKASLKPLSFTTVQHFDGNDNRIRALISSLSSSEENVRAESEHELISFARTSSARRKIVVQELLGPVENQEILDGKCAVLEGTTFFYWASVTKIFAQLRAREAVDIMVKDIHCGNGYTGSLGKQPAYDALVRLGELAVPKLSEALPHERDVYKRIQIIKCLGAIGSPQAKQTLRRASLSETNKEVLSDIRNILSTRARKRR